MVSKIVWLSLAGALGTLARYGLTGIVTRINGDRFPWGTLAVNLTGCFIAGLLWTLFEKRWGHAGEIRILVMVGFMGAFTTFSSFILETGEFVRSADWMSAAANIAMQNTLGVIGLFLGATLARVV